MSWIERLQNKSKAEKIKILWMTTLGTLVVLVALWLTIGNVKPTTKKNTDLFKTIENSVKNFKFEKPKFQ